MRLSIFIKIKIINQLGGFKMKKFSCILILLFFVLFSAQVYGKERKVNFVYVSWTGVTLKTEIAKYILGQLGYTVSAKLVSVPICYMALKTKNVDIFLGNWMPVQREIYEKYKNHIVKLATNMDGAIYTLAVPKYVYEAGVKHFKDLDRHKDKFNAKIYGLEEGNMGNEVIRYMINNNLFSLKDWELVVSSEPAMLSQVKYMISQKKWVAFLGWQPHHMNIMFDMAYLDGSTKETFGENNGESIVNTIVRVDFVEEYPNVSTFLKNLKFSVDSINKMMLELYKDKSLEPKDVAVKWLNENKSLLKKWLKGVKTADGKGDAYKIVMDSFLN